jgi:hypothetical protein
MNWLDSILAGAPTPEAVEHLQRGFAAWLRSGGHAYDASGRRRPVFPALSACLGLSANPATAALRMRDAYLRHAADLVGVERTQTWRRATQLAHAANRFLARRWPCWWNLSAPPTNATRLDALLWHATQAGGGRLPTTPERFMQILRSE